MASDDGIEISIDPDRVDLDVIWDYLSKEAYWGRDRSRQDIETQVRLSWRLVGAYDGAAMIGFARALSDGIGIAYLGDVFVLDAYQGRGVAQRMLAELIENGPGRDIRWILFTKDAHGLYEKFGFGAPDEMAMVRPAR